MQGQQQPQSSKKITIPRYSDKFKNIIQKNQSKRPYESPSLKRIQNQTQPQVSSLKKQFFFYKVKTIGVGAHSFVYLVQQQTTNLLFAQKSITKQHAQTQIPELIRQTKILSLMTHDNLIKLYHCYCSQTHINLIMQYAQDSLFNLKQKFILFKQKQIIEVMRQLLHGLDYLHQRKIVHADVKLQNIMIANGTIKLCDFGYAHREEEEKGEENKVEVVGTMEYLPPEYARGYDSGVKRDIWAVGILAFQMLVGKNPFQGMRQSQKWSKLVKTDPQEYQRQLQQHQLQLNIKSQKIQDLTKNIFRKDTERWTASQLLQLPFFIQQPTTV